jgi:hypothetical protein
VHAPAALAQCLGHGQAGEDVAAGAAGHDQAQCWLMRGLPASAGVFGIDPQHDGDRHQVHQMAEPP